MADLATLGIQVSTRGMTPATREMHRLETQAGRTEKSTVGLVKSMKTAALRLASLAGAAALAGRTLSSAQAYVGMTNSLRAMGLSADQSVAALDRIAEVAQRTRAPLEATAQLYQRISIAGRDLGASSSDVLRFTENVGLALAQTGGSAASASGALLQLSQAMSGGVVRAEEFNSILEGAFPIAQAAANAIDGASGSVGRLRNMVIEGEISSREFFEAIISQTPELEAAFANTVPTIGQAFTVLGDGLTVFIGKMDAAIGVSGGLASGILFLADHINDLAGIAVAAAITAVGIYTPTIYAAVTATGAWIASLITLRGALLATGIGAVVVAGGLLIGRFLDLVQSANGFGRAMGLLGDVVAAVWQGMVTSAGAIPPALNGVWELMKAGFLQALAAMADEFYNFVSGISRGFAGIEGMEAVASGLLNVAVEVGIAASEIGAAGDAAEAAAAGSFSTAAGIISGAFDPAKDAIAALSGATADAAEEAENLIAPVTGVGDAAGGAGKAAGAAAKEIDKMREAAEKWKDATRTPLEKYTGEVAELDKLLKAGALDGETYRRAVEKIGLEFADSMPAVGQFADAIGNFVASGMRNFGDLLDSFKDMIRQMIATAIANPIKLALVGGVSGGGVGAAAAGAAPVPGMGGGIGGLAGAGGMLGGIGSAFMGGMGIAGSGFMSGGIGGMFTAIGGQLGVATSSATAFAGALGAVAVPLLAVAAVFSFFRTKTKELDAGLRVTVSNLDVLVEQFRVVEKSKFWGLSKSVKTHLDAAADEIADPITRAYLDIRSGVEAMAETLGLGTDALNDFSMAIELSTKGMSQEEAIQALEGELEKLGIGLAERLIGSLQEVEKTIEKVNPFAFLSGTMDSDNLMTTETVTELVWVAGEFGRAGETALDTLTRLSQSITAVNRTMDTLQHTMFEVGLAGADMASDLIDAFGGMEAFSSATSTYFQSFYSEAERLAIMTRQTTTAVESLGLAMPTTRAQYRAMVEALDLTTQTGREAYAALVGLSGVMADILPAAENLTAQLSMMVGAISTDIDGMIAQAASAQRESEQAAGLWYRTAQTLRGFIADLRGTAGALVSGAEANAFNEARFQSLLASALAGDAQAATDITGAARALLNSTQASARTAVDVARAEARVLADLSLLSGASDIEGARHDVIAGLQGEQVALLSEVRDYLTGGGALDADQIDLLNGQLGALQQAIASAEMINYAFLRERLAVTVDLLATADLPPDVRRLIANAQDGIIGTIDFVARSNLGPDEMWLALTGSSEHIRTIQFILDDAQWPDEVQELALSAGGVYRQTIQFIADNTMPADLTGLALDDASELLRAIRFTAGALPPALRETILADITTLQRRIDFMVGDEIPDHLQSLAMDEAESFLRVINTVAGSVLPSDLQRLALENPAGFTRSINFLAGRRLVPDLEALATEAAGSHIQTITFLANNLMPADLTAMALDEASELLRSIQFTAGALPPEVRDLVLTEIDELLRVVNFQIGEALPGEMVSLALDDAEAFTRIINTVAGNLLPADVQRLALDSPAAFSRAMNIVAGNLPGGEIRRLALDAATRFDRTINFRIGNLLPHYLQRLALQTAGEFTQTVNYVRGGALPDHLLDLTTDSAGTFVQTVQFLAANMMSADFTSLAIEDASELLRSIEFVAGALPAHLREVILDDMTTLQRRIDFILGSDLPEDEMRLALEDAEVFTRVLNMVGGNVVTGAVRDLALAEPGAFTRSLNVLAGRLPEGQVRRLALEAASSFERVINLSEGRTVSPNTARLALDTITALNRTINLTIGQTLTADQMRVALAGSSEMSRVVNVALSSDASPRAIQLALGNINRYQVIVNAALESIAPSPLRRLVVDQTGAYAAHVQPILDEINSGPLRRLLLAQQGDYAAMIEVAFAGSLNDVQRRILLEQQGVYITRIAAILSADVTDAQRLLLLNANTNATRGITILAAYGDQMTAEQRHLLGLQTLDVTRTINAVVDFGLFGPLDWALFQATDRSVWTTLRGQADLSRIAGGLNLRLFRMDNETIERVIRGDAYMTPNQPAGRRVFWMDNAVVRRDVRGTSNMESSNQNGWRLFWLDGERVNRDVRGTSWMLPTSMNGWRLFNMEDATLRRTVAGNTRFDNMIQRDWRLFWMQNETLSRTIRGSVDMSSLTGRQLTLFDAITGATSGRLTLGGSFVFDPSASFSTWFGRTTTDNISTPISALRSNLTDLAAAVRADTASRAAAEARQVQIAGLQASLTETAAERASVVSRAQGLVGQIEALEASTGVSLRLNGGDARLGVNDAGQIAYAASHVEYGAGADLARFNNRFRGENGLEAQLMSLFGQPNSLQTRIERLRDQITGLGAIPAFAAGGVHSGGWARVGEEGPELVNLGPSRIYSAPQTRAMLGGDQADVVRAIHDLKAEVARLRDENRQLGIQVATNTKRGADVLRKWDTIGQPAEQTT